MAATFVRDVSGFSADVRVTNLTRNPEKSVIGVMGLGVSRGHRIRLSAEGPDAAEAAALAREELVRLAEELRAAGREEEVGIPEAQALMAADPELIDAAARVARHVAGEEAPRLSARSVTVAADLPPSVTVAADLPPSVTVELDRSLLAAIALEGGSRTSHAAILARALGIPAVVAVAGLLEAPAAAYEAVLRAAGDAEVVFRLADIGGDKPLPYLQLPPEPNPFLGVRAVRLTVEHRELLTTQLRAILLASERAGRPASIMAPMVDDLDDLALLHDLLDEAQAAVREAPPPRVGIMVEIPSAALLADRLAGEVDFMSIGTNDLTQYLLAADRSNAALAARQDPLHPAVLRAVGMVVTGAGGRCEVAVCGEMAGDPLGARLLIGLGADELSMEAAAFGAVKRAIGACSRGELIELARRACDCRSAAEVRDLVGVAV